MSQWIRPTTRWAIYLRDGMSCVYCGVTMAELVEARGDNFLTVDHVKTKSKGGTNHPTNIVTCCYRCNLVKGCKSLSTFCKEEGLVRTTVRSRMRSRQNRPVEHYREAARVLLGNLPGVPMAELVADHDWLVKGQWTQGEGVEVWEHLKEQGELFCATCTAPVDEEGIYRPQEEVPF